ncbi:anti-sigma factor family protein [Dongia sp.]|uniref:anti-sigma factor family protein n=1 Tax=Dongia sp. TaxID=1977262 RepID=UPI003753A7B0
MSVFDPLGYIMDCESLHLYFDGELDTVAAIAFEKHLETCAQCRAELAEFRDIRRHLHAELTRMPAGDGLQQKIQSSLDTVAEEEAPVRRRGWSWQKLAVAAAMVAMVSSGTTFYLEQPSEESLWLHGIVNAHERALLAGHSIDVASSSRHTVKPWFSGKTTIAPLVADLSDVGFPLVGGRLDVPLDRAMPAIVYGAGPHLISLYMRPADGESAPRLAKLDGFSVLSWRRSGFAFTAVSDADGDELAKFQQAFTQKSAVMQ